MHPSSYLESIVALCFGSPQNWPSSEIDWVEEAEGDFEEYDYLFFDIDDTLNADRVGLNVELCQRLDQYAEKAKVVLLTNCSKKREEGHKSNLSKFKCKAELWAVGQKPNYRWLSSEMLKRNWTPNKAAMFGDRPTMDVWCAYKCGFKGRYWVKGWFKESFSNGITDKIKRWEWRRMEAKS